MEEISIFLKKQFRLMKLDLKFFENELGEMGIVFVPSATNFITTIWKSEKEAPKNKLKN